jgi:hypothetical protein
MPTPRQQPEPVVLPRLPPKLRRLRTQLLEAQRAATPSMGGGWQEVDLSPALDRTDPIDPPSVLHRDDDGVALLYPGRINVFAGETEALKTFLALFAAVQEIRQGHHVVYVDYEDSRENAVGRLRALGARDDDIRRYFHYFSSQRPVIDAEAEGVLAKFVDQNGPVTLAIFDSVTAAMVAGRLDLNDGSDVTTFYSAAPRWFADHGAAALLIDHVTKDKVGRGRYPIGSERKLSGIDGAAYLLKTVKPFGRGRTGRVEVAITKDRPGHVRQYEGQRYVIAIFEARSMDNGKIEVSLLPGDRASDDGSVRLSGYMERASKVLETASGPLSAEEVRDLAHGKNEYIRPALRHLVQEGYARTTSGPRGNSTLYLHVKPFPDRTSTPGVFDPEDDEDFDDEPPTKSLGTPPVLSGVPHKGGGTGNESTRQVPGTPGNRSGTTSTKGKPGQNQLRRTPLAGVHRVPIRQKAP